MIDEELYQKATDELNSENRRPHIWARACALANDDHDEARYLYTNLRVEELLKEGGESDAESPEVAAIPDELKLEPIEFEGLPEIGDGSVASIAAGRESGATALPGSMHDKGTMHRTGVPARAALDLRDDATHDPDPADLHRAGESDHGAELTTDEHDLSDGDDADRHDESTASVPADDAADDARAEAAAARSEDGPASEPLAGPSDERYGEGREASHDGPVDEFAPEARDGLDEPFTEAVATADRPGDEAGSTTGLVPVGARHDEAIDESDPADDSVVETIEADDIGIDDTIALDPGRRPTPDRGLGDLDWLDEAYRAERESLAAPSRNPPDLESDADALTRELHRQAEELPGSDPDAVISHDPTDTLPTRRVGRDREVDDGEDGTAGRAALEDELEREPGEADVASNGQEHAFAVATDQPLELSDGRAGDTEFAVFAAPSPDGRPQTVRQGGSWGALFATLPWLIHRHLFGTALVYALFAIAVLAGLAVTGVAWYDAGGAATFATRTAAIGFALLAVFGLLVLPFRSANHWREDKLERRGFELVAYVRTQRPERALELARQASDRLVR